MQRVLHILRAPFRSPATGEKDASGRCILSAGVMRARCPTAESMSLHCNCAIPCRPCSPPRHSNLLQDNMTGSIPESLGSLHQLEYLYVDMDCVRKPCALGESISRGIFNVSLCLTAPERDTHNRKSIPLHKLSSLYDQTTYACSDSCTLLVL